MCALPLFVASDGPGSGWAAVRVVAYVLGIGAFALSCAATVAYAPVVRRSLATRDAGGSDK
jgi:hypothetical protein